VSLSIADIEYLAEELQSTKARVSELENQLTYALHEPYLREWLDYLGSYRMRIGSRYVEDRKNYSDFDFDANMRQVDGWFLESVNVDFFFQHETFPLPGEGLRLPRGFVQDRDRWIAHDQWSASEMLRQKRARLTDRRETLARGVQHSKWLQQTNEEEIARIDAALEGLS
jgi:hypothetical protein